MNSITDSAPASESGTSQPDHYDADRQGSGFLPYLPGERAIFAVIIAVGALLRLRHLGVKSFWFDEWRMFIDARKPFVELLAGGYQQTQYPVGYFIERLFLYFGETTFFARLPWALIGIVFIFAVYLVGRNWFGRRVALLAAMIVALNPAQLLHSQEAKPYTLFCLAALLASYYFFKAINEGGRRNWALYLPVVLVLRYTHPYSNYLFLAHALYFVFVAITRKKEHPFSRRRFAIGLAVLAGILVISVPAVMDLSKLIQGTLADHSVRGYNLEQRFSFFRILLNYFLFGIWTKELGRLPLWPAGIFVLLMSVGITSSLRSKRRAESLFALLNAAVILVAGFLLVYVVLTVPRYFLFIEVFLIYFVALGAVRISDLIAALVRQRQVAGYLKIGLPLIWAVIIAADASVWIDNYYNEGTHANGFKRDMRKVARIIESNYRPGDHLIGFSDNRMAFELLDWRLKDKIPQSARTYVLEPDFTLLDDLPGDGRLLFVCIHDGVGGQAILKINKRFDFFEIHKVLTTHVLIYDPRTPTAADYIRHNGDKIKHIGSEPVQWRAYEIDFIGPQVTSNEIVRGRRTYPMIDGSAVHYLTAIDQSGESRLTLTGYAPREESVRFAIGFDGVKEMIEKEMIIDGETKVDFAVDLQQGYRKLNLLIFTGEPDGSPDRRLLYLDSIRFE